jgi:hypothetical protein
MYQGSPSQQTPNDSRQPGTAMITPFASFVNAKVPIPMGAPPKKPKTQRARQPTPAISAPLHPIPQIQQQQFLLQFQRWHQKAQNLPLDRQALFHKLFRELTTPDMLPQMGAG